MNGAAEAASWIVAQTITPGEAASWANGSEKLTVVGILFLGLVVVLIAISRRWYLPVWMYVEMKDILLAENAKLTKTVEEQREALRAQSETINRLISVSEGAVRK